MQEIKPKKGIKEFFRKFTVSLKKRPNRIPQFVMVVTFVFYSIFLTKISDATAYVNKTPMGLCSFITMLFSALSFVISLNAFVPRSKPKIVFVILLYLMQAVIIGSDVWYLIKIKEGLDNNTYQPRALEAILAAQPVVLVHCILVGISIVLFALIPIFKKLLNKIDTSVDLGENEGMKKIELEDEE